MASELKHTVKPSGGDFTTLADAIAHLVASHANLVTADVYATIEIDGAWSSADTAAVEIAGITTDATRYISIYTTPAARHSGMWNTGKYILGPSAANSFYVNGVDYVYADGLQLSVTDNSGKSAMVTGGTMTSGANEIVFKNCIVKGPGTGTYAYNGILNGGINCNAYFLKCLVYNIGTGNNQRGIASSQASSTTAVYNCVAIGGAYAIRETAGTMTCKNCYAGGSSTSDYSNATLTTCASEDATGSAGLQGVAIDIDTFVNVTGGSEDFHLAADGNSPLQGAGTDTSGEGAPLNFTTDIDGDAWDVTWDIGVDAPGPSAIGLAGAIGTGFLSGTGKMRGTIQSEV